MSPVIISALISLCGVAFMAIMPIIQKGRENKLNEHMQQKVPLTEPADVTKSFVDMVSKLSEQSDTIAELRQTISDLKDEHAKSISELKDEHAKSMSEMRAKIDQLRTELKKYERKEET